MVLVSVNGCVVKRWSTQVVGNHSGSFTISIIDQCTHDAFKLQCPTYITRNTLEICYANQNGAFLCLMNQRTAESWQKTRLWRCIEWFQPKCYVVKQWSTPLTMVGTYVTIKGFHNSRHTPHSKRVAAAIRIPRHASEIPWNDEIHE